jgi:hypothetical protein
MKYTIQIGSGAMIYIPSFIMIGSGIQKLIMGIQRHNGQRGDCTTFTPYSSHLYILYLWCYTFNCLDHMAVWYIIISSKENWMSSHDLIGGTVPALSWRN